jgi:MoxR-like ATPase
VARTHASTDTSAEPPSQLPPSILTGLGIIGMQSIEPVLLGALLSGEPLLLIGPHGTGKSFLLARLCQALGLEWRHYNASMLNFDDLVGFPLPDGNGGLQYIQTPSSIWGAEAVFVDEISRCRPDLQNKLFPIIHERRVQGIALERLVYRWSAMNPPTSEDADETAYVGSELLDAALADRFAFVIEIPAWEQFTEADQEGVILSVDAPIEPLSSQRFRGTLNAGRSLVPAVRDEFGGALATYVRLVVGLIARGGLHRSPRRAAMLLRNIAAVHAARILLGTNAELGDSAWLALINSVPQRATGHTVSEVQLLAAHREAWSMLDLESTDPRRLLLAEVDPLRRAMRAARFEELSREDLSRLIADCLADLEPGTRHALAVDLFESGTAGRLSAAVAEQCAELYAIVAAAQDVHESLASHGRRYATWQAIAAALARLPADDPDTVMATNLTAALFARGELATTSDVDRLLGAWHSARAEIAELRA